MKPNLVTEEDQCALWENLDIIDCFATDHGGYLIDLSIMNQYFVIIYIFDCTP